MNAADYSLVPAGPDRLRDILNVDGWAFPTLETLEDQVDLEHGRPWGRAYLMLAPDGQPVATHCSYAFERFGVPGGHLRAAGLSWVGVHPQHRRRGLLTAMIDAHLGHCAQLGEPVSALSASEAAIYGRFGYGKASEHLTVTIPRGAQLRPVTGSQDVTIRIEHADAERHLDTVMAVQREAGRVAGLIRPGWVEWQTRSLIAECFQERHLYRQQRGYETLRIMIAEQDGRPVGYAFFRRKGDWDDSGPSGKVWVSTMATTGTAATHALWSRLTDLDLMSQANASLLPLDDPLLGLLVDQRSVVPKLSDGLWVRVVDLPAALSGRQYAAGVDAVLEVTDERIEANAGRWRLRADAFTDGARVEPTTDEPDLRLDVRELGAILLGGTSLAGLACADLVHARDPETLAKLSTAFGWPLAPAFNWVF